MKFYDIVIVVLVLKRFFMSTKLVQASCDIHNAAQREAYGRYTGSVVWYMGKYFPITKSTYDEYDKAIRKEKAKLSQGLGTASKNGKSNILECYVHKMAKAKDLDLSTREVDAILKYVAGRSLSRESWGGLFTKDVKDRSLYFTDDKAYKDKIHNHRLIKDLRTDLAEYDAFIEYVKANRKNPFQAEIDKISKMYKGA